MASSRTVYVKIVGDSRDVERALARTSRAAKQTAKDLNDLRIRARRASSIGPFRLAAAGGAAGVGLFAATQVVRELGDRLKVTGEAAFSTEGKLRNMVGALTSGSLVGAFDALTAAPKKFEDFGVSIEEVRQRQEALKAVADGLSPTFQKQQSTIGSLGYETANVTREQERMRQTMKEAGVTSKEQAKILLDSLGAYDSAATATEALADQTARLGQLMVTQSGALVTWKGAVDDLTRAGRGEAVGGAPSQAWRQSRPSIGPLSASQRRELDLIGKQGTARLPGLQDRLRQLRNQEKARNFNDEQRLRIMTNIKNTEAEIAAIYKDQAAARRAAAAAAKAAAEAAAAEAERQRQAALAREQARELRILAGPIPTVANLRKQFAAIQKSAAADKDFPRKLTERFAGVARLLKEKITPQTREAINDFFQTVRGEFDKNAGNGIWRRVKPLSDEALFAGLGLSRDEKRGLTGRLGSTYNISGPVTIKADNPDVIARELQKRARRQAVQSRGTMPGSKQGLDG